jgi:hypothetical protein
VDGDTSHYRTDSTKTASIEKRATGPLILPDVLARSTSSSAPRRFPGENLVLRGKLASFVEIYRRLIPVEQTPNATVTFGNLRVNGTPVDKPSATAVYQGIPR